MSRWVNNFEAHGFINTLHTLTKKIDEIDLSEELDNDAVDEFGRLKKVVAYINQVISSVDPELISTQALNEMQRSLQAALNEFNVFEGNQELANLQNSNNNIDSVLNVISRTFVFYSKPTKSKLKDVIKSYTDILDQHRKKYQSAVNEEVNKISDATDEKIKNIKISADETNEKLKDIDSSISALKEEISDLDQQAQSQFTDFNQQFRGNLQQNQRKYDHTVDKIEMQFDKKVEEHQKRIDAILAKAESKIDDEFNKLAVKAGKIIEVLEQLQENAEVVFGVVQNTVQAGAHKRYADEQGRVANSYRYGAIFLMLSAVAVLVVPELVKLLNTQETLSQFIVNINWDNLLKRLPISAVLFAPAFYIARESNKHRQNEFQNRRRELTLRTIDPYLALIEENTKREDLKCQIARDIFGETSVNINQGSETSDVLAQLSNLTNSLSKVMSKK